MKERILLSTTRGAITPLEIEIYHDDKGLYFERHRHTFRFLKNDEKTGLMIFSVEREEPKMHMQKKIKVLVWVDATKKLKMRFDTYHNITMPTIPVSIMSGSQKRTLRNHLGIMQNKDLPEHVEWCYDDL